MKKIIYILLFLLLSGCSGSKDDLDFSTLREQGQVAFNNNQYLDAVRIWNQAYDLNPKDVSLILDIGKVYLRIGRLERAKVIFKEASRIDPDDIKVHVLLAQAYFQSFDFDKADEILKRFKANNINHFEFDLIRADIFVSKNRLEKAEFFYREAVKTAPESSRAKIKLALFLKSINKLSEADKMLFQVEQVNNHTSAIYILISDYYLLDDQISKAEKYIHMAIDVDPGDKTLKYHLIQFYLATENSHKAETLLKEILKKENSINIQMVLADTLLINGKIKEAEEMITALKDSVYAPSAELELLQAKYWLYTEKPLFATPYLKSALDLKPGLINTRYMLGLTYLINGKNNLCEKSLETTLLIDPDHYKTLLLISQVFYKEKKYRQSLKYLNKLLENFSEDFSGRLLKGLNYLGLKEYDRALDEFKMVRLIGTHTYIADYYIGMTHELNSDYEKAIVQFKKILDIHPEFVDVSYKYAMLLINTDQLEAAGQFIKSKLNSDKENPNFYELAAQLAHKKGLKTKVIEYLEKAVSVPTASGRIYLQLANVYQQENQTQRSIEILRRCTEEKPYYQLAWLELSKLYADGNDLLTALEIMEHGYKKFSEQPVFQSNLAWLLLENDDDLNRAMTLAQSAYDIEPDSVAFADTLGWAYYKKGIFSQAAWLFSQALEKMPDNGFLQYHLGLTYYRQGKFEKAVAQLTAAKNTEESIYFKNHIDETLEELANQNNDPIEDETIDSNDIFSAPKVDNMDDDMIVPQWQK